MDLAGPLSGVTKPWRWCHTLSKLLHPCSNAKTSTTGGHCFFYVWLRTVSGVWEQNCSCYSHPTCDANHSPLCWIQDLPWGWLGAFDPLVFGQVPGQGVSKTGDAAPLSIAFLEWGSIPASVFAARHHLPSGQRKRQSLRLTAWMRMHTDMTRTP